MRVTLIEAGLALAGVGLMILGTAPAERERSPLREWCAGGLIVLGLLLGGFAVPYL